MEGSHYALPNLHHPQESLMSSSPLMPAASRSTSLSSSVVTDSEFPLGKTITLGKLLSLTVTEDSLIILDENIKKSSRSCCSAWPTGLQSRFIAEGPADTVVVNRKRTIALYNILWADVGATAITLNFAESASNSSVRPTSLTYPFQLTTLESVEKWVLYLLDRAYEDSLALKRFKVIINPFGGSGQAVNIFEKQSKALLEAARCKLDIEHTTHYKHAVDIAENLDIDLFDGIICCSGDGVPHEVFNGFAKRNDATRALNKIAVCQLPGGSGNAMCWNLTGTGSASLATVAIIKGKRRSIDLLSITQGNSRLISFLSQSVGMIAEVDLGTEHLRWMGDARFTVGLLQRISRQTVYPCDISIKTAIEDKDSIRDHYRTYEGDKGIIKQDIDNGSQFPGLKYGTVNDPLPEDWETVHHAEMGIFYAGNMAWMSAGANFFPASCPRDGFLDVITIPGTLSRLSATKVLLAVEKGHHFNLDQVNYKKVVAYRITPHKREGVTEEYVSIDGERVDFAPLQVEVHQGLGTVLAKGDGYEAPGV